MAWPDNPGPSPTIEQDIGGQADLPPSQPEETPSEILACRLCPVRPASPVVGSRHADLQADRADPFTLGSPPSNGSAEITATKVTGLICARPTYPIGICPRLAHPQRSGCPPEENPAQAFAVWTRSSTAVLLAQL